MNETTEHELERFIDDELRRLPTIAAPNGLTESVLGAIHARQNAPWWTKSYWSWPPAMRVIALLGFIALGSGMALALASLNLESWSTPQESAWMPSLVAWGSGVAKLVSDQILEWVSHPQIKTWLAISCLVGAAAYLAVIIVGSACFRIAFQPKQEA